MGNGEERKEALYFSVLSRMKEILAPVAQEPPVVTPNFPSSQHKRGERQLIVLFPTLNRVPILHIVV